MQCFRPCRVCAPPRDLATWSSWHCGARRIRARRTAPETCRPALGPRRGGRSGSLVNIEALRAPFAYRGFEGVPRVYDLLAMGTGRVVLAETPFYPPHAAFENAEYVLNSTAHWRPLMNGYSGYTPASYRSFAWTFWYFPRESAVQAMPTLA